MLNRYWRELWRAAARKKTYMDEYQKFAWLPKRVSWVNGVQQWIWLENYHRSPHDGRAYVSRLDDPTERRLEEDYWDNLKRKPWWNKCAPTTE